MDDLITEFIAETREMLQALELGLVAWERDPASREQLDAIFRFVHTVKGNCGFFDLPRLEALAHAAEDALGDVRSGQRAIDTGLVDAVLAVIDRIGEMVEQLAADGKVDPGDDQTLIAMLGAAEAPLAAAGTVPDPDIADIPVSRTTRAVEAQRSVRLPTSLVDRMMSGVSDMILVRNELERQLRQIDGDPALLANFGRLSGLLTELQSAMTQVRMQPIGTLLGSYQRMIRDLAAELGKQVEVEVESGQVELDREMIELLRDPLLHIIRNAIDHGIEAPEQRIAAGKRPSGRLMLSARQTGNEIRIAILDDGRGIDADQVVARAIARGAISEAQAQRLDPAQRLALICEPGVSTACEVTQISGRGVGMDVVRASIERIGGKLRILSQPGDGCRILLDVPLTLSIVPSITAAVSDQVFAVPRSYVREIVRNSAEVEVDRIGGMRHVNVRGELHPCIGLAELLGIPAQCEPEQQTLIMIQMIDGAVFALSVDGIADHCDLVIRPVARQVIATGLYVGVAQLNDGKPALMLDVAGVSRLGGMSNEQHTRLRALEAAPAQADERSLTPMIVFAGLDGIRRAVAMDLVERLLEVPVDQIGRGGGQPHIVFDNEIVPLHGLVGSLPEDRIDVLVIEAGGLKQAHATCGAVDTADIDPATITRGAGGLLALLDGASVELLDPGRAEPAGIARTVGSPSPLCRLPVDDHWCREVLRPLVESAGYRVTFDADGEVDLQIVLEGAASPAPEAGAAEVLLIGATSRKGEAPTAALDRNDPAALLEAVKAVRRGRGR